MATTTITDGASYRLPNGEQVVASDGAAGGYTLYTREEWNAEASAAYAAEQDVPLAVRRAATGWTLSDLRETGHNIEVDPADAVLRPHHGRPGRRPAGTLPAGCRLSLLSLVRH